MAYAEVDQLNDHLGDSRSKDEDLKQRALDAATEGIESLTGRRFSLDDAASARTYSACDGLILTDDFTELVSVSPETAIGVLGNPVDPTSYRPTPLNAPIHQQPYNCIDGYFAWGTHSVTAIWGWPAVPASIVQACLLIAARVYKRRESPTGILGFDEFAVRVGRNDPDVVALLDPYRWLVVG